MASRKGPLSGLRVLISNDDGISAPGIKRLEKSFSCKNFAAALALTNRIAVIAEQENHHPAIVTEWGRVTVSWWTHAIDGLHVNDFIMAARTDRACAVPVAKAPSSSGTA